jgi:hypothetical protein
MVEHDPEAGIGNALYNLAVGYEYAVVRDVLVVERGSITTAGMPSATACRVSSTVSVSAVTPVPGGRCFGAIPLATTLSSSALRSETENELVSPEARRATFYAAAFCLPLGFVLALIGVAAKYLYPDMNSLYALPVFLGRMPAPLSAFVTTSLVASIFISVSRWRSPSPRWSCATSMYLTGIRRRRPN